MWICFIPIAITTFMLICVFGATSCSDSRDPNLEKAIQGKVSKIEYKNHYYVVWSINFGGGIVHDPDCKCLKVKEDK